MKMYICVKQTRLINLRGVNVLVLLKVTIFVKKYTAMEAQSLYNKGYNGNNLVVGGI